MLNVARKSKSKQINNLAQIARDAYSYFSTLK